MIHLYALLALAAGGLIVVLLLVFGRRQDRFEVTINAPARTVWEHWIVACGHQEWRPLADIQSVEQVSEAPLTIRVKAVSKGLIDQTVDTVWRYEVYEPYRRYEVRTDSGGGAAGESGELTESGGSTRLEFTVSARWSGAAGSWRARRRVEQTLKALKVACEVDAAQPGRGQI